MLTRVTPRLILLDIQMPEMDGLETCRRIRAIRELAQVPVAFLTASKSAEDVRAGLAAGGNDFIVKPFDIQKLLLRVEHWTTRRIAVASSWDIAGR
jgi:DNA-binding response OmpR family regulator